MSSIVGEEAGKLFIQYFDLIKSESDRGAVLVAACLLESGLESALKTRLVPISGNNDPLFNGSNSILGTFSSKIEVAYRVGIIPLSTREMLNLFRKMRNDFAHNALVFSLEEPAVKDRLLAVFNKNSDVHEAINEMLQSFVVKTREESNFARNEDLKNPWPIRVTFNFIFSILAMALNRVYLDTEQIEEFKSID